MTYLVQEFGKKSQKELEANELELKQPWNTAVPIQALFFRVDKCRRFDPTIPEANIVRIVVGIICSNKGFGANYKEWLAMRDACSYAGMNRHCLPLSCHCPDICHCLATVLPPLPLSCHC